MPKRFTNQNKSKKRLKASDVNTDLLHRTVYAGPVYMGSASTELNLIYDTNERWLSVEESGCDDCLGTLYSNSASTNWVDGS